MKKSKKIWKKRGLWVGALFLLYLAIKPFFGSSPVYIKSALADAPALATSSLNSQTIYLPQPTQTIGIGGADDEDTGSDQISVYVVRAGDTLSDIAKMYGVTENTIIWANDLKRGADIKADQHLIILPVSGLQYVVQKGDTLSKIALKYKGDIDDIRSFNGIASDSDLRLGAEIIIPDGEDVTVVAKNSSKASSSKPSLPGFFGSPLVGYARTQGLHGHNGVDIVSKCHCEGAPILASAEGEIIISKNNGGYNGGYGNYIVIAHGNGTQTLYAHLQKTLVGVGARVSKGQTIGTLGDTGKSTGPHLHFEVRGAHNPF